MPSWISRGLFACVLTVPNAALVTAPFGAPNWVRLNEIEDIDPELDARVSDQDVLGERHVNVLYAVRTDVRQRTGDVAKGERRRGGEYRAVEPSLECRLLKSSTAAVAHGRPANDHRKATLPARDRCHGPASDERLADGRQAAGETLSASKREVVDRARHHVVPNVECGQRVFGRPVVVVQDREAADRFRPIVVEGRQT